MNPNLTKLQPYPFEKLNKLLGAVSVPKTKSHIPLSIGEPNHSAPEFVKQSLVQSLSKLSAYPSTKGSELFRQNIARWLEQRFNLGPQGINAENQVLPVNGTREALFSFAQTIINPSDSPFVICPNPFYQIYEGAALLAGATPYFLPCLQENHYVPDYRSVPDSVWKRCQLLYLCNPGNPTGAITPLETLQFLIEQAQRFDFVIASDECYSEIFFDERNPPPGLLEAASLMGLNNFDRCVVFHSLSKRSNLPGLRSGFVAGDASVLKRYLTYRTYHGSAMPVQHQLSSISAWNDEEHVIQNRKQYRDKFNAVLPLLDPHLNLQRPDAGFYLWPQTPIDDTQFAQHLFKEEHITVLPGSYLSRTISGLNPGENRIRLALVAPFKDCIEAAERIANFCKTHYPT